MNKKKYNVTMKVNCPLDGVRELPAKQLVLEPAGRHSTSPRHYLFTCDACGATYRKPAIERIASILKSVGAFAGRSAA